MAGIYGCYSKVNLLKVMNDMLSFGGDFGGSGFFEFLVQEFPSTTSPDDKMPQAALNGLEAIMSALNPGTVLVPVYTINSTGYNPGSLLVEDRVSEANTYSTFLGMALMGSLQYRYGAPTSNNHKSVELPWTTAAAVTSDGCAYAAGTLNFLDGLNYVQSVSPPNVASKYASINGLLGAGLTAACKAGCTLCGGSVSCTTCPRSLRSASACTGSSTDVNSCAASGIALFVNSTWTGPP